MFVVSVKTNRRRLFIGLICAAVLLVTGVLAVTAPRNSTAAETTEISRKVASAEERVAFLRALGHEIDATAEQVQEITVPQEADETLKAYNALQQQVGLSLEPYAGRRVRRYTYTVSNAESEGPVLAHLYVYHDRVIAGDLTDTGNGGEILPLIATD